MNIHLAVSSKFDGYQKLPAVMEQLDQLMEESFMSCRIPMCLLWRRENEKAEPGMLCKIPG